MSPAARAFSSIGAALVALAVFVPYAEYDGNSTPILDLDAFELTYGFAIEPLAVALAALSPLVLTRVSPRLLGMLLAATGAQTTLMYLGYLLVATQDANDPQLGAFIGIGGSLLIFTAGVLGLRSGAPLPGDSVATSSPPAGGWYPDPTGTATERYWNGEAWTEQVR